MTVVLLIRHGVTAMTGKRLYGRSPGVHLSDEGRAQSDRLAERLGGLPVAALYSSPLERCAETAEAIARVLELEVTPLDEVLEVDYGRWTGRPFAALVPTRLWRAVHRTPSTARFPGGETLMATQRRLVDALEGVAARHPRRMVAVVSHGDPIALAIAHYAGLHIDMFQRLDVSPASVSALRLGGEAPRILRLNDTGRLDDLMPARGRKRGASGRPRASPQRRERGQRPERGRPQVRG